MWTRTREDERLQGGAQMTPMIDIVFQLLVFFIMTFKIVAQEGDFNVKMPLGGEGPPGLTAPLRLRLAADPQGGLAAAELNGAAVEDWAALHRRVAAAAGGERGPDALREELEVIIDCDYGLRYEHTMAAITAVSGSRDPQGGIVPLVERISFAAPGREKDR